MSSAPTPEVEAARVARQSYGKLVAYLAARSRDVASAEDALAEAFAAALAEWPRNGLPRNPEGWLLTVARRKQIDVARRGKTHALAQPHLELLADEGAAREDEPSAIPDHRLGLMFACAHPAIDPALRTPLILQAVLGFDAATIASAFLVSPAAMSQRLVRGKAKIKDAGIPLRVPEAEDLPERLDAVLEAVYAAYTQGWNGEVSEDAPHQGLAAEALYLGDLLTQLLPDEPEALGLSALMLFADSRKDARRDGEGRFVPLSRQDTGLWDAGMIAAAEAQLLRASRMGRIGRFQLEAAVQSAHVARAQTGQTDWAAIVGLYDGLLALTASPVAAINRAVALAEVKGPEAGLAALAEAEADPVIVRYQPYWAARAELLARNHDAASADAAYAQAIGLSSDPAARAFLMERRQALQGLVNRQP